MNMLTINGQELAALARQKRNVYTEAQPFPHIVLDGLFDADFLKQVLAEFPSIGKDHTDVRYENPNEHKQTTKGEYRFGDHARLLTHYLNSQPFLDFLQHITGIRETLLPDPYLEGGGFHETRTGGFLKMHVDFHKHKLTDLARRVNLVIYLNEDWAETYGGHLELWDKGMNRCMQRILPVFNRVVIFSTTDYSWHGHPDPLTCPEDRSRRSLALYYYSNGREESEVMNSDPNRIVTTFAARPTNDSYKMKVFNSLVNTAVDLCPPLLLRMFKHSRNK